MLQETNFHYVDYTSLGYGYRIGLFHEATPESTPINPRHEIGKFGISAHSSMISRIFYKTIAISATDARTKEIKTLYLNRSSTIKWLNAQLENNTQLPSDCKDSDVINRLVNIERVSKKNIFKGYSNNRPNYSFSTQITAIFYKIIYWLTSSSWALFKLRMALFASSEFNLQKYSESLACSTFNHSVKHVRAYKDFVGAARTYRCFREIPITSKKDYITAYTMKDGFKDRSLYVDNEIPSGSKKDTSTGTSGQPTSWYRGPKEIHAINQSINFSAKFVLGDRPYYLINGFALGPWATGIAIANAAASDPNATVCNIGLGTPEIFSAIKAATHVVPKDYPIVVAGYPPHLKEVVDLAIKENFPLSDHNIIGIVGGESISENQRSLIVQNANRTGFRKCYSAYGASDLDVAIGYETDLAIEIRQELHKNPRLAKELLGESDFVPMIFPYDPLNYHIETDDNQNLIYTCVRGDRISPRVRYNLGDRGKTMLYSDVMAILKKHNVPIQNSSPLPLPFLFVWGRVGTHVSLEGLKIAPENLDDAIKSQNLSKRVLHHGFLQFERSGEKGIEILIEMDNVNEKEEKELSERIISGLMQHNEEFNKLMRSNRPMPVVRFYNKGTSPMSVHRERYPHQKKQYIFNDSDQFVVESNKLTSRKRDVDSKANL